MKKLLLFLLFAHASAFAAPFGLEWGMMEKDFGEGDLVKGDDLYEYKILSVPNPHSDFDVYFALITPNYGLCKILALGKTIEAGYSGSNLKNAFNHMEDLLAGKYGSNKKFDYLHTESSIWSQVDWMVSIKLQERTLASIWDKEQNSTLPDGMESVRLQVNALSGVEGYLTLSYDSNNISKCSAESKKVQSDSL